MLMLQIATFFIAKRPMGNFRHQEAIALTSIRYVNVITNFQVKGAQINISEARRLKNIAWEANQRALVGEKLVYSAPNSNSLVLRP